MNANIKKWGNSLGLIVPKTMIKELNLVMGSEVDMRIDNGKLIIEPKEDQSYNLDDLLDEIKPGTHHEEIDLGDLEGNEVW